MNTKAILLVFGMSLGISSAGVIAGQKSESSANLLANGGFEEWREVMDKERNAKESPLFPDGVLPSGWRPRNSIKADCRLAKDAAVKHGGNSSLRFESKSTDGIVEIVRIGRIVRVESY
ncbi:MAG: hypothetical protein WAX69_13890 [Victivallales bacterium]